jgi:thioredoxin 1
MLFSFPPEDIAIKAPERRSMLCRALSLIAVLLLWSYMPAAAGTNQLAEGISLYNARQYAQGLARLQSCLNAPGTDLCAAHYYMGLCYQNLNQIGSAQSEYSWVVSHEGNPVLRYYAGQALAQLQQYKGRRTYDGNGNVRHSSSGGNAFQASASGRPKVLDFWASWCGPCKELAPTVEEAQSKYSGRVEFVQLDADSDQGKTAMRQYNVNSLPTLIYLDSGGKVVDTTVGVVPAEQVMGILDKLSRR